MDSVVRRAQLEAQAVSKHKARSLRGPLHASAKSTSAPSQRRRMQVKVCSAEVKRIALGLHDTHTCKPKPTISSSSASAVPQGMISVSASVPLVCTPSNI